MRLAHLLLLSSTALMLACGDKDDDDDDDDTGSTDGPVDADGDGFDDTEDCDDDNGEINPDATEVCDGVDNDCDGDIDDEDEDVDLSTGSTFYGDNDEDGYGAPDVTVEACALPEGLSETGDDCDDDAQGINPGATEICDENDVDENCSGTADDDDPDVHESTQTLSYPDVDTDGFGDASDAGTLYCDPPTELVLDNTDCDDDDSAINPDATEVCDDADVDEDCDGVADDADTDVDAADQPLQYVDVDTDGYGDASDAGTLYCDPPSTVVTDNTDCDDTDIDINPAATEVCDAADVDEDCDTFSDDDDFSVDTSTQTQTYPDVDTDGYGDASDAGTLYCDPPSTVVTDNTDCDDTDIHVNPAATEVCDGWDNDCDSGTSEAGMASLTDTAGTVADVTSSFSAGTSSTPAAYTAATAGTLSFCDDTFYTNITVEADLTIQGINGTEVLDGALTAPVIDIQTDALTVTIQDLTVQNGYGTGDVSGYGTGFESGGGVNCEGASSLTIDTVSLTDNLAEIGGGIAIAECTMDLVDVTLTDNAADYGGGLFTVDTTITAIGSTVSLNTADSEGGGAYLWDDTVIDIDETLFIENDAREGGAVFVDNSQMTCTGTTTTDAGFFGNTATYGAAVFVGLETAATFSSTECDFGVAGTADDNGPPELFINNSGTPYVTGDDATFSCDDQSCGTPATHTVGTASGTSDRNEYIKGNAFVADTDVTLHGFNAYLGPESTCTLDFYVLSNSTIDTTGWVTEWSSLGHTAAASTYDWQDSGDIDMILQAGTAYSLAVGYLCDGSDEVNYAYSNDTTADASGFGAHVASINYSSYSDELDGSESLSVGTSTTRARYYMEIDITEL